MAIKEYNEDTFNRLAKAIMIKYSCRYETALSVLNSFSLDLVCNEDIRYSQSQQAALLTAINSGKRTFLGGIKVQMPKNVQCLLPWPTKISLNKIVEELTGKNKQASKKLKTVQLLFGSSKNQKLIPSIRVISSGWIGGFTQSDLKENLSTSVDFSLGGVLAAGLSISAAFLYISGLKIDALDKSQGISLWNPELNWLDKAADGPKLEFLPKKLWLLGLGHLGQAYLWNLSFLPYSQTYPVVLLQDFDKLTQANITAALISNKKDINKFKTRICSTWLEKRGFEAIINERKFDNNTKRSDREPYLALCGFDKAEPRRNLENAEFGYVVEAGLGGDLSDFDTITLHTFPGSKKSSEIWAANPINDPSENLIKLLQENNKKRCGVLEIAKKAISTSYVGAVAGSLAMAEILRGLHGGSKYEFIMLSLRDFNLKGILVGNYSVELAKDGFVEI